MSVATTKLRLWTYPMSHKCLTARDPEAGGQFSVLIPPGPQWSHHVKKPLRFQHCERSENSKQTLLPFALSQVSICIWSLHPCSKRYGFLVLFILADGLTSKYLLEVFWTYCLLLVTPTHYRHVVVRASHVKSVHRLYRFKPHATHVSSNASSCCSKI